MGSVHVRDIGLKDSLDNEVWEFAKENGFSILTKDTDFLDIVLLKGSPPKCIYLALGNCSTSEAINALNINHAKVREFLTDKENQYLVIEQQFSV